MYLPYHFLPIADHFEEKPMVNCLIELWVLVLFFTPFILVYGIIKSLCAMVLTLFSLMEIYTGLWPNFVG
jgi:hypothetical protein